MDDTVLQSPRERVICRDCLNWALLNRHGEIVGAHHARIVTSRGRIERETR
jgi:hypothetical protein